MLNALYGGLLIGGATVVLLFFNGRIAGVSGIFSGLLHRQTQQAWRWAFIFGLVVSPFLYGLFAQLPEVTLPDKPWLTAIAGLCVGVGTKLANGCTSGHGVCGIARLSRRSIVATITFMTAGVLTVFFSQYWGL